jgi:hypothetical protein
MPHIKQSFPLRIYPLGNTRTQTQQQKTVPLWLKQLGLWTLCSILSFSLLIIATKTSPLYPINDWPDANTFLTLGKGMMKGLVPYRDLFEQKGPLLYFIHGLASLVSNHSFLGVFFFEVISFTVFLYFTLKTIALFIPSRYSLLVLPIFAAAVLNLRSFAHGDTAESFVFPFLMVSLHSLLKHFKEQDPEPMDSKVLLVNGIMAGCVLWIKYAFLGFWLGWILLIFFSLFLKRKYLLALKASLVFLAGMLIATVPWLVYFSLTRSLSEWINTYFILNLTIYPEAVTFSQIIRTALLSFKQHLTFNPPTITLLAFGTLIFLTTRKFIRSPLLRGGLFLSIGLLALGVYGGGKDYIYYFLVFAPFLIFGFILLANFYAENLDKEINPMLTALLIFLVSFIAIAYTLRFNRNTYMLDWEKSDMVQFKFAARIHQSDEQTLLNYGFQDAGFYTAAGIIPNVKYYQKYNFTYGEFPINMDEQNRYVQEERTEFLVLRLNPGEKIKSLNIPYLDSNYHMIDRDKQSFGETEYTYLLYQRNN